MQRPTPSPLLLVCLLAACSGKDSPPPDSCGAVPATALVTAWTADPHYCMIRFADNLPVARQIAVVPNGDIFVAVPGQLIVIFDANGDGVSDAGERTTFAAVPDGNHGLTITSTHVYASSPTTVYRWPFKTGDRTATGAMETVVTGIQNLGHNSRSLVVDGQNRLYVEIGSAANVDLPGDVPWRAQIRRFNVATIPTAGYDIFAGELFASGLRNEVGLSFDSKGRLWGVENGRDNLVVGGDIHFDNPAEEVNLFDINRPGRFYGFPFCWSEGIWMDTTMAKGPGTQHLDPQQPGDFTEARCQDPNVVVPPAFALGAHLAPLDIIEYRGGAYPSELSGDMFVTSHGSWNRETGQVGRLIIRLKMGANAPTEAQNFLGESDGAGGLRQGLWGLRPVSIRIDHAGLLTFSDDSGTINKIGYRP
jgi:glucose/arabinose dehydrogenase